MLQYFTGGKNHNIQLRSYGLSKGKSLNEYGIKDVKTGKLAEYATEQAFYKALGLPYIEPELREDRGELDAAKAGKLPHVVELGDVKGDLHIHTSYDLQSSHDLGTSPLEDYLNRAAELGYEYIGLSDHNPRQINNTEKSIVDIMKRRKEYYEKQYEKWISRKSLEMTGKADSGQARMTKRGVRIFIMCEVDIMPDGNLALPDGAFDYVDGVVVSLHSSFTQERKQMTERIIKALTHPKVRIMGHPTGRLLSKREGVDANWSEVFAVAKQHDIAMEINSYPDRLDLPDALVYDAVKKGVKLCIDTDSHDVSGMVMTKYGVSVARRGWATSRDIVNTLGYNEFKKWLVK
jgi:DNA polymerase (family 10)